MHQSKVSNFNNIFSKIGFNDPISSQGATFKLTFYGHMDEEVTPQTFLTEGNDNTFTLSNSLFDITVTFDVTSGGITVTNVSKSEGPSWSDSQEVINQTLFSSDTASFVDVEGLGKIELSYTNSEGVTKIASVEVQQGSWNDGRGSVLAETENFLPYSDRYTTVEVEDVVARVHKNTGKFEGIKGIETGPEDHFEELLTPVLLSRDYSIFTIGKYACTAFNSLGNGITWNSYMPGRVSTIYFGDYSKLDTITTDYLFSVSTSSFTVTKGPSWNDSSINGFDLIYTSSVATNCTEIHVSCSDGGSSFVSDDGQIFAATSPISLPYNTRITKHSHSISRQGECAFSEIVETGDQPLVNPQTLGEDFLNELFGTAIKTNKLNMIAMPVDSKSSPFDIKSHWNSLGVTSCSVWLTYNTSLSGFNWYIGNAYSSSGASTTYSINNPDSFDRTTDYTPEYIILVLSGTYSDYSWDSYHFMIGNPLFSTSEESWYEPSRNIGGGVFAYKKSTSSTAPTLLLSQILQPITPSVDKSSGVLTCGEFIEGDYSTTIKYLDGFSGSVSGNKITCNNGYTFEMFSDSESSVPVSFSSLFSSSLVSFVGLTDPSDSSGYSITGGLNSSSNFIFFDTTYNSSTGTRNWSDSMKLYVDSIGFSNINLSVYYIKITDPEGTSKLYVNSSSNTPYFYPISNSNQLWIPSKYRYQNYLI